MQKKFFLISALVVALLCMVVCASADQQICEKISYYDADGNILTSYTEGEVTAVASCTNTTSKAIKPVLVVTSYRDGQQNGFWYASAESSIAKNEEGLVEVTFTPAAGDVIKATLIDSLQNLNPYLATAKMLNNTTNLDGVFVDGVFLPGFTNDEDAYEYKVTGAGKVTALAEDGSSAVTITEPESLPGYANVNVLSAFGDQRDVSILMYKDLEDLYTLKGINYIVNGTEYSMPDFNHDNFDPTKGAYIYSLSLPDNTLFAELVPIPTFEGADIKVEVEDTDHMYRYFDGLLYRYHGFHRTYINSFGKARGTFDNIVPIKNEEVIVTITVSYGDLSKKYRITMGGRQPRLTSYNFNPDAVSTATPVFVGGAAVNNDNGTTYSIDRWWAFTNVSENLVGASMFVMPVRDTQSTSWWGQNTEGVYFDFTADTPGTIYMIHDTANLTASNINPAYIADGWEYIDRSDLQTYTTGGNFAGLPVTFNDFGDDRLNICMYSFSDDVASRYGDSAYTPGGRTLFDSYFKRDFQAGEVIEIHNTGSWAGTDMNSKHSLTYLIVWDIEE